MERSEVVTLKNGWIFQKLPSTQMLSASIVHDTSDMLAQWAALYPREGTWVEREYRVPTIIARLDFTIAEGGKIRVYEIDDRPAGIGVTCTTNPEFKRRLARLRRQWPSFYSVISPTRPVDDVHWVKTVPLEEAKNSTSLILVRARPEEEAFHSLAPRSVSTIAHEGRKEYGVQLGLWKHLSDPDLLPWEEGFVLKPNGTRSRDVLIWPGNEARKTLSRKPRRALPTSSQIQGKVHRYLSAGATLYIQPYHPPMRTPEGLPMIYRFFFGFNPTQNAYVPLGGIYNAMQDSSLLVHGTDKAAFGPLEFGRGRG